MNQKSFLNNEDSKDTKNIYFLIRNYLKNENEFLKKKRSTFGTNMSKNFPLNATDDSFTGTTISNRVNIIRKTRAFRNIFHDFDNDFTLTSNFVSSTTIPDIIYNYSAILGDLCFPKTNFEQERHHIMIIPKNKKSNETSTEKESTEIIKNLKPLYKNISSTITTIKNTNEYIYNEKSFKNTDTTETDIETTQASQNNMNTTVNSEIISLTINPARGLTHKKEISTSFKPIDEASLNSTIPYNNKHKIMISHSKNFDGPFYTYQDDNVKEMSNETIVNSSLLHMKNNVNIQRRSEIADKNNNTLGNSIDLPEKNYVLRDEEIYNYILQYHRNIHNEHYDKKFNITERTVLDSNPYLKIENISNLVKMNDPITIIDSGKYIIENADENKNVYRYEFQRFNSSPRQANSNNKSNENSLLFNTNKSAVDLKEKAKSFDNDIFVNMLKNSNFSTKGKNVTYNTTNLLAQLNQQIMWNLQLEENQTGYVNNPRKFSSDLTSTDLINFLGGKLSYKVKNKNVTDGSMLIFTNNSSVTLSMDSNQNEEIGTTECIPSENNLDIVVQQMFKQSLPNFISSNIILSEVGNNFKLRGQKLDAKDRNQVTNKRNLFKVIFDSKLSSNKNSMYRQISSERKSTPVLKKRYIVKNGKKTLLQYYNNYFKSHKQSGAYQKYYQKAQPTVKYYEDIHHRNQQRKKNVISRMKSYATNTNNSSNTDKINMLNNQLTNSSLNLSTRSIDSFKLKNTKQLKFINNLNLLHYRKHTHRKNHTKSEWKRQVLTTQDKITVDNYNSTKYEMKLNFTGGSEVTQKLLKRIPSNIFNYKLNIINSQITQKLQKNKVTSKPFISSLGLSNKTNEHLDIESSDNHELKEKINPLVQRREYCGNRTLKFCGKKTPYSLGKENSKLNNSTVFLNNQVKLTTTQRIQTNGTTYTPISNSTDKMFEYFPTSQSNQYALEKKKEEYIYRNNINRFKSLKINNQSQHLFSRQNKGIPVSELAIYITNQDQALNRTQTKELNHEISLHSNKRMKIKQQKGLIGSIIWKNKSNEITTIRNYEVDKHELVQSTQTLEVSRIHTATATTPAEKVNDNLKSKIINKQDVIEKTNGLNHENHFKDNNTIKLNEEQRLLHLRKKKFIINIHKLSKNFEPNKEELMHTIQKVGSNKTQGKNNKQGNNTIKILETQTHLRQNNHRPTTYTSYTTMRYDVNVTQIERTTMHIKDIVKNPTLTTQLSDKSFRNWETESNKSTLTIDDFYKHSSNITTMKNQKEAVNSNHRKYKLIRHRSTVGNEIKEKQETQIPQVVKISKKSYNTTIYTANNTNDSLEIDSTNIHNIIEKNQQRKQKSAIQWTYYEPIKIKGKFSNK